MRFLYYFVTLIISVHSSYIRKNNEIENPCVPIKEWYYTGCVNQTYSIKK